MQCEQAEIHFAELLFDELDADTRGRVEAHLAGCRACSERLGDMRAAAGLLGEALHAGPAPTLAPERRAALLAAADRSERIRPAWFEPLPIEIPFKKLFGNGTKTGLLIAKIAAVLALIASLVALLLPSMGAARRTARQMQSSTQLRGLDQGMILYSESHGGHYPEDPSVLLKENYVTPGYFISPMDKGKSVPSGFDHWSDAQKSQWVRDNSSYVFIRSGEKEETTDSQKVVGFEKPTDGRPGVSVVFEDNNTQYLMKDEAEKLVRQQTGKSLADWSGSGKPTGAGGVTESLAFMQAAPPQNQETAKPLVPVARLSEADAHPMDMLGRTGARDVDRLGRLRERSPQEHDEAMKGQSNASAWTTTDGDWRGSMVFGDKNTQFLTTDSPTPLHQPSGRDDVHFGLDGSLRSSGAVPWKDNTNTQAPVLFNAPAGGLLVDGLYSQNKLGDTPVNLPPTNLYSLQSGEGVAGSPAATGVQPHSQIQAIEKKLDAKAERGDSGALEEIKKSHRATNLLIPARREHDTGGESEMASSKGASSGRRVVLSTTAAPPPPLATPATPDMAARQHSDTVAGENPAIHGQAMNKVADLDKKLYEERLELKRADTTTADKDLSPAPVFRAGPVNPWVLTTQDRFSTFALDVDTASYTIARSYINRGQRPPRASVRMEEYVNAFDYNYPRQGRDTFAVFPEAARSPFAEPGKELTLLKVGVQARVLGREGRKPANLTFVIDTSGSMARPDRLPLVQRALEVLLDQLSGGDRVSIVTFGPTASLITESTPASDKKAILDAIHAIRCQGSTNLVDGLRLGYTTARRGFVAGAINRVVLCSDGVANVGQTDADAILQTVESFRKNGVTFTSAGFGSGSYNDDLLEKLADRGDGNYVFIDSEEQAKRVFVDQMAATLQTVAEDAKIQVEFNPARVRRYRLIGYENRALADKDFRNDAVAAGQVGSGQAATALYELELIPGDDHAAGEDLGTVFVRSRNIDTGKVEEISRRLEASIIQGRTPSDSPRFYLAAAAARFAETLRGSEHVSDPNLAPVERALREVVQQLPLDTRVQELLRLVQQAEKLPAAQ